jgi:hypothetical protein
MGMQHRLVVFPMRLTATEAVVAVVDKCFCKAVQYKKLAATLQLQ